MRSHGFSLIELVVTMSIAAILATMSFPTYRDAMHRSQRLDARLALQRIQYLQEKHYAQHLRYASRLGDTPDAADVLVAADRSQSGNYSLSISAGDDGQTYVAAALARADGRQAGDSACQHMTIDETGLHRSADAAGNWSSGDPQRCWG